MERFTLKEQHIRRLAALNLLDYDLDQQEMVFFGIRGAAPVYIHDPNLVNAPPNDFGLKAAVSEAELWADSHDLIFNELDFDDLAQNKRMGCTLGQWDPKKRKIAIFAASTIPNGKFFEKETQVNMLLSGRHKYVRGPHPWSPNPSTQQKAFRLDNVAPILRTGLKVVHDTNGNSRLTADYDASDTYEYSNPNDNIHSAWCAANGKGGQGAGVDNFESQGCQVVAGYPGSYQSDAKESGPWKTFRTRAYDIKTQNSFPYLLFKGNEVLQIGKYEGTPLTMRVRFGSRDHGNITLVKDLQNALNKARAEVQAEDPNTRGLSEWPLLTADGQFGINGFKAVKWFQDIRMFVECGDYDRIVGPATAAALGIELPTA
ncbi:MAG: hypothetical protein H6581_24635 [Bacteroidia bacterium]|nr:hypothetical protein [Bacteroidia bacterium]